MLDALWEEAPQALGTVLAAVQQNGTAVAVTAALLGWTLWLVERARSGRLSRALAAGDE